MKIWPISGGFYKVIYSSVFRHAISDLLKKPKLLVYLSFSFASTDAIFHHQMAINHMILKVNATIITIEKNRFD
jgi:hypothetical protein